MSTQCTLKFRVDLAKKEINDGWWLERDVSLKNQGEHLQQIQNQPFPNLILFYPSSQPKNCFRENWVYTVNCKFKKNLHFLLILPTFPLRLTSRFILLVIFGPFSAKNVHKRYMVYIFLLISCARMIWESVVYLGLHGYHALSRSASSYPPTPPLLLSPPTPPLLPPLPPRRIFPELSFQQFS